MKYRFVILLSVASICAGCDHDGGSSNKGIFNSKNSSGKRSMSAHSGKFTKGYQDGMKDAKDAWGDMSGAWGWLWLTEKDYQDGYDRGWKDGREIARLQKEQATMRSQNSKENAPAVTHSKSPEN